MEGTSCFEINKKIKGRIKIKNKKKKKEYKEAVLHIERKGELQRRIVIDSFNDSITCKKEST